MRRYRFIILLLVSHLTAAARVLGAQGDGTLTGRITGPAGEPLAGAQISATGIMRGAIARADGASRFALPAGRREVRGRLLGYAAAVGTVAVAAGAAITRDFSVRRAATTLETIAIVGSRGAERTVISAPVPIDVLSAADLLQS